jgi:hypothetical protein
MLGVIYPEIFAGAIPICGVNYFRQVPVLGQPDKVWPPAYSRPPLAMLNRAKAQSRFVLITGSEDSNRDSVSDIFEQGYKRDGFRHMEYVEVPQMGHRIPEVEWIERAIQSLDAPLTPPRLPAATRPAR